MVSVDEAVIARLKKGGTNLEILVDCEKAMDYKSGKSIPLSDVVISDKIFFDVNKGMLASETKLGEIFGTSDSDVISERIIKEGEVQITAEFKNKLLAEKKKNILQMIHNNAIDPKSGNPIPLSRLELALDEAKIKISEHKGAEEQMKEIVKKLHVILPIKIEKTSLKVKIPPVYAAKGYSQLRSMADLVKEEWLNDGSLLCHMEVPAGQKGITIDKINGITKGEAEIKVN